MSGLFSMRKYSHDKKEKIDIQYQVRQDGQIVHTSRAIVEEGDVSGMKKIMLDSAKEKGYT